MSLHLLLLPCGLSARSKRSWSWTSPARLEKLRHVNADGLCNGMKEDEARARGLPALETGERPDAHSRLMGEPLLGDVGRPAEVPQVLGNTPEYVLVAHAPSRRLPAILFQATRCWFYIA